MPIKSRTARKEFEIRHSRLGGELVTRIKERTRIGMQKTLHAEELTLPLERAKNRALHKATRKTYEQ